MAVPDRRGFLMAGLGLFAGDAPASEAASRLRGPIAPRAPDDTGELQVAIDRAVDTGVPLRLGPGVFHVSGLVLPSGLVMSGVGSATRLLGHGQVLMFADGADDIRLSDLVLDGAGMTRSEAAPALLTLRDTRRLVVERVVVRAAPRDAIHVEGSRGRVRDVSIVGPERDGLVLVDSRGIEVAGGEVVGAGGVGLRIARRERGEDGTRIAGLAVETPRGRAGITVERASGVTITGARVEGARGAGIAIDAANAVTVEASRILGPGGPGIAIAGLSVRARIAGNRVEDASVGVEDRGPGPSLILGNAIARCRIGIALAAPDAGHVVADNLVTGAADGALVAIDAEGRPRAAPATRLSPG